MAEQIQPAEIVRLAQWVLIRRLFGDGEELGSDDFTAILEKVNDRDGGQGVGTTNMTCEAFQMICIAQSANELASQMTAAFCADPVGLLAIGSRAIS